MHKLLDEIVPELRWDGVIPYKEWKAAARARLYDLLGISEILPFAVEDPQFNIEFDRIDEEKHFREIRFTFFSEKDVLVPCHLVVPIGAKEPLPTAICVQGHGTGMHISLGRTKYPHDSGDFSGNRDFAVRNAAEGICSVALEQRCFGECGNNPETGSPNCEQASMRALLLGRTMIGERVWDISRCIDILEKYFADIVDAKKILCMGNSGGGTATVYAAAMEDRIRIAIPSCAVTRYADSIAAMHHCQCNYIPRIAKYFDMGEIAGMIAPNFLVQVNGQTDGGFPIEPAKVTFAETKRLYTAAGVPDNCTHVIGSEGHRFYADASWPTIRKYLELL